MNWISVKDKLPVSDLIVLVWFGDDKDWSCDYYDSDTGRYANCDGVVTHWCEIIAPVE